MMSYKKQLLINLIIIISTNFVYSYTNPFYDNSRYPQTSHQQPYDPYSSYYRYRYHPYRYHSRYPGYPEEFYYNPIYYLSPRAAKYSYYRHSLPYYYQELPTRSRYDYLGYMNPTLSHEERLMQAIASEQRQNAQPIGHEVRYEHEDESDDNNNENVESSGSNISLLNNLMMQKLYGDSLKPRKGKGSYKNQFPYEYFTEEKAMNEDETEEEQQQQQLPEIVEPIQAVQPAEPVTFAPWEGIAAFNQPINVEDENVKELRELPKKQKQRKPRRRKLRKNYDNDVFISSKRSSDNIFNYPEDSNDYFQSTETPAVTETSTEVFKGQKEEMLYRPAIPVKTTFKNTIMGYVDEEQEKIKRTPSVYDKLKQLLDAEDRANEPNAFEKLRKAMTKRLVSNEDTLTQQLSVLKKTEE